MDIRIGFADSARDVAFSAAGTQEELLNTIQSAVDSDAKLVTFTDEKGKKLLVRTSQVAWIEVGSATSTRVGFAAG